MQTFIKRYFAGVGLLLVALFVVTSFRISTNTTSYPHFHLGEQSAAVLNLINAETSSQPAYGFAWNDNVGWINFGSSTTRTESQVYVSNNKLYGYAWGENIGWISMNCANTEGEDCFSYGVSQDPDKSGTLTGYAWGENIGWIDFAPTDGGVHITTNISGENTFSGYAWGENIGWISFSGVSPDYGVSTTWIYPSYPLSYIAGDHGSIGGSNNQIVREGGSGTAVTANPDLGYHFVNWSDDSTANPRTDTNIIAGITFTANFAINTYNLTYSTSTNNGHITGTTNQVVNYGASGSAVNAIADTGYHFVKWSDNSTDNPRTDTNVTSNISVSASFAINTYNLTYSTSTNGYLTGSTTQVVNYNTSGTEVRAIANGGYRFEKWSDGVLTAARTDTNVTNNISVTATFIRSSNNTTESKVCVYDDPAWGDCVNSTQSRTLTAINQPCDTQISVPESRQCTVATTTIIIISPLDSEILTGDTLQLHATTTVNGSAVNDIIIWTVSPIENIVPDFYGSINNIGLYTAPEETAVNVVITAYSQLVDPTKFATTSVTVKLKYNIYDGYIFNNDQKKDDRSEDVANLQNRLKKEGYYSGYILGGFGDLTVKAVKDYQTANNLPVTGELDLPTRNKLNGIIVPPEIATTTATTTVATTTATTTLIKKEVEISPTTITLGDSFTIYSSNWAKDTEVTITLYSDPVTLGTLQANSDGEINGSFTIPNDTAPGSHTIKLNGTGSDSSPKTLAVNITVQTKAISPVTTSSSGGGNGNTTVTDNTSTADDTGSNVPAILDLSGLITENIAVLGTTTEKIYLAAKEIVESPVGSAVTNTITTVGVVGGGVAATGVLALNGTVVADLLFLPFRLWGLLLSALGLKKRNRPWGTVYDSVTKQPIDPAYVTLTRTDVKEENTSITDLDGRYGFLTSPGKYTLAANKTNYTFPSQKVAGKTEDVLYGNLYFGEEINVDAAGALISKNIPLDPVKFDWNEFVKGEKKLMKFYSKREKIVRIVTDWVFRIGFVISLIALFLVSAPYNLIIFGLYLILTALRKFGLKQKALGSLTDKDGNPLSYAIIRAFDSELNVEITNKVADKLGRYYCLVNKGKYYVKIERKNDDETYTEVYTSPIIDANNGIINQNYTI